MNKGIKTLVATALLAGLALPASASVVTFTDGSVSHNFDQLGVQTFGDSIITQTYVDGTNDTFVETGLTAATTFRNNGSVFAYPSGFDLIFNASLFGTAATTPLGGSNFEIDVTFGSTSVADLIYDDVAFGGLNGTQTTIASLTNGRGNCKLAFDASTLNSNQTNEGTCNISFDFTALVAGWFKTASGEDFTTYTGPTTIDFALDIDIKSYNPGNPVTNITVSHAGNAIINVPEPTSLAILGLGLLGFAGARRRKS